MTDARRLLKQYRLTFNIDITLTRCDRNLGFELEP